MAAAATDADTEVDVVIAGGGACGMMTALRAAANPDRVIAVFEKSTREGCNAAISSGSLAAAGTRFQRGAGIDDSPQRHADELLAESGDEQWRPIVEGALRGGADLVEWIADTGYPIEIGTDMPRAGMSVPRLHTDVGRQGGGRLMRHLRGLLESYPNVAFVDEAPVVDLIVDSGEVRGVVVAQNGAEQPVRADSVVLATDGFANNPALFAKYLSHLGRPFYGGVSTSTGDALAWVDRCRSNYATWAPRCDRDSWWSVTAPGSRRRCRSTGPSWSIPTGTDLSTKRHMAIHHWPEFLGPAAG